MKNVLTTEAILSIIEFVSVTQKFVAKMYLFFALKKNKRFPLEWSWIKLYRFIFD